MKENGIGEGFWVFVSHSTKDFERVRLVRNALEDSGFRPILFYLKCMEDEDEINELLKREIDARRRFILCDSPNAQASKFVQSEVNYIRSKKRMYEIVDLSSIDLDSRDLQDEILKMIKPFRVRTNVFLSYNSYTDSEIVGLVKKHLALNEFISTDVALFDSQKWYRHFGGQEGMFQTVREVLDSTLSNGYFLYFLDNQSWFTQGELELAYEIAPNMVLPITLNGSNNLPTFLLDRSIVDVSIISSDEDKAKAIVEALIIFDLKNQNNK